jgi:ABC-type multidrug transport system fused ATPase/permease subunit
MAKTKDKSKNTVQSIKYVFKTVSQIDKAYFLLTPVNMLIMSISPLVTVILPKYAIDAIAVSNNLNMALTYICIMGALMLLSQSIPIFLQKKIKIKDQKINMTLHSRLCQKTITVDYEKLENPEIYNTFEFAKTCIDHSGASVQMQALATMVSNFITLIGLIYVLSPIIAVVLPVAAVVLGARTVFQEKQKKVSFWYDKKYQPFLRRQKYVNENLTDYSFGKEVRIFNLSSFLSEKFVSHCKELYALRFKALKPFFAYGFLIELTGTVLLIVMYGYVTYLFVNGSLTLGDFSMYFAAVLGFNQAIKYIFASLSDLKGESRYINHYKAFLEEKEDNQCGTMTTEHISQTDYQITFENVWYRYPGQEEYVLKNLNLSLKSKEKLSVIGVNGAGKTTFVKLLMGLLSPTEGKILLNGIDIKEYDYAEYTSLFSTVFQDFNIFSFIVSENICFDDEVDREKMWNILQKLEMAERIDALKLKENTFMGKIFDDGGIELSGGQKQKLAIARALYKDAPVYILDEPTAALSPQSEADIYNNFKDITEDKTVVYISHRLSSSKFCDKIAVFEDGCIVEYGSHDDLYRQNGLYRKLFDAQAGYYLDREACVV